MGLRVGETVLGSRLVIGSARYASPETMLDSIRASGAEMVTVSLRRQNPEAKGGQTFWDLIRSLPVRVLPNTAGCRTTREAVTTAQMAREIFDTNWIKLELVGDEYTLQPDPIALVESDTADQIGLVLLIGQPARTLAAGPALRQGVDRTATRIAARKGVGMN